MSEISGTDAFMTVLDRLIEAEKRAASEYIERTQAQSDARTLAHEAASAKSSVERINSEHAMMLKLFEALYRAAETVRSELDAQRIAEANRFPDRNFAHSASYLELKTALTNANKVIDNIPF